MKHHFIDRYSGLNSLIHRQNTKLKLLLAVGFVVFVISLPRIDLLNFVLFQLLLLVLIFLSKVPLMHFVKNYLVLLPFILLAGLSTLLSVPLTNSQPASGGTGLHSFLTLLARSTLSVETIILLVSTTRFDDILKALNDFKVPSLLVSILSFIYRYIFLIVDEFLRTRLAAVTRSNGRFGPRTWAQMASNILLRSIERGEMIYLSMKARGFDGEVRTLREEVFGVKEWFIMAAFAATIWLLWKI